MNTTRLAVGTAIVCAVVLALSGCRLFPTLPGGGVSPTGPSTPNAGSHLSSVKAGDCLSDLNGQDSDRTSLVACTEPHLFDVLGVEEWPGMEGAVDKRGAADEFDVIINGGQLSDGYYKWASTTCSTYLRKAAGLDDISLHGKTAADMWLTPGGTFGVDLSLASRKAFIAGDHSTVCSVVWLDADGIAPVKLPAGVSFSDVLTPDFPSALRDCETVDGGLIGCDQPHDLQVLLNFDGLSVFGADAIKAPSKMTDEEWQPFNQYCLSLFVLVFPDVSLDKYLAGAIPGIGQEWDDLEAGGEVDPESGYFFDCVVVADDNEHLVGDVMSGGATSTGVAS